jgi:dolichyl-phosphate-mannose--protein O-mannosyl transferase
MKTENRIIQALLIFSITLIVGVIVSLLWNILIDKSGAIIDWKTSFMFAIMFAVIFPVARQK